MLLWHMQNKENQRWPLDCNDDCVRLSSYWEGNTHKCSIINLVVLKKALNIHIIVARIDRSKASAIVCQLEIELTLGQATNWADILIVNSASQAMTSKLRSTSGKCFCISSQSNPTSNSPNYNKLVFGDNQNYCLSSLNHYQRSNATVFPLLHLMGLHQT